MRRATYERELKPKFGNLKLVEITDENLRAQTDAIVARGAPATAVHVREVALMVYRWAIARKSKNNINLLCGGNAVNFAYKGVNGLFVYSVQGALLGTVIKIAQSNNSLS